MHNADENRLRDTFEAALGMARELNDSAGITGWGVAELRGPDGNLKQVVPFANKITTYGDEYYSKKSMHAVQPSNSNYLTVVAHMKLGTGSTAEAKSGAGAAIVTYIGSGKTGTKAFDSTFPDTVDETGDTGFSIRYKTSWAAGEGTDGALREAVISTVTSDTAGAATDTISRVVFASPIAKGASDTLAITWKHTFNAA